MNTSKVCLWINALGRLRVNGPSCCFLVAWAFLDRHARPPLPRTLVLSPCPLLRRHEKQQRYSYRSFYSTMFVPWNIYRACLCLSRLSQPSRYDADAQRSSAERKPDRQDDPNVQIWNRKDPNPRNDCSCGESVARMAVWSVARARCEVARYPCIPATTARRLAAATTTWCILYSILLSQRSQPWNHDDGFPFCHAKDAAKLFLARVE